MFANHKVQDKVSAQQSVSETDLTSLFSLSSGMGYNK